MNVLISQRNAIAPSPAPAPTARRTGEEDFGDVDRITEAVLTASRLLVAVSARSLNEAEDSLTLPQFRALVRAAHAGRAP